MTIDADGHIMLPPDIWDKYFERGALYDRRPCRVADNFGRTRLMVDGEFIPRRFGRWREGRRRNRHSMSSLADISNPKYEGFP